MGGRLGNRDGVGAGVVLLGRAVRLDYSDDCALTNLDGSVSTVGGRAGTLERGVGKVRARRLGLGGKSRREHVAGPKTTIQSMTGSLFLSFFQKGVLGTVEWNVDRRRRRALGVQSKACSDCRRVWALVRATLDGSVGGKKYKTID
jgi:hypothetical protein